MRPVFFTFILLTFASIAPARATVNIQEVTSKKGVTAWLVEDHSLPIISVQFAFEGGKAQVPAGKEGMARLICGLFDEGAGELDSEAFQKRLEDVGAEMSFDASADTVSGQMRMLSENRDDAFDLLRLAVTSPRFDKEPVERIRGQIAVDIRGKENNPRSQGTKALAKALYGDHPYSRMENVTVETLETVTQDDLRAFHRKTFARSNLVIGVVGDIDPETLSQVLDKVFGDLPEEAQLDPVEQVAPHLGQEIKIDFPLPQASIQLVYPGIGRADPAFYAAYLMDYILGGGTFASRLFIEVREKRGLAYSAGSWLSTKDYADTLMIHTATRAESTDDTLSVIKEVVRTMSEGEISEEDLEAAKTYVIGAYPINTMGSSSAIANTLVNIQKDKLGIDYIDRRIEMISAITLDEVKAVAKRLLTAEPTVMVIGPEKQEG